MRHIQRKLLVAALTVFAVTAALPTSSATADPAAAEKGTVQVASPQGGIVEMVAVAEGHKVKKGDVLLRLDDRIAKAMVEIRRAQLEAARADLEAMRKTADEAKERYKTAQRLFQLGGPGRLGEGDLQGAKLTMERYASEVLAKEAALKVAEGEVQLAHIILDQHTIRSPMDGVVQTVGKKPGEAAKALDTVVILRAAGNP